MAKTPISDRPCEECGESYAPNSKAQRFCSRRCSGRFISRRDRPAPAITTRQCRHCGADYQATGKSQRFCSKQCAYAGRARHAKPVTRCSTSGCSGATTSRGMCSKHYQQFVASWRKRRLPMPSPICTACGDPYPFRSGQATLCESCQTERDTRHCPHCWEPFVNRDNRQEFCSKQCKDDARKLKRRLTSRKRCAFCESWFMPSGPQRWCSTKCRVDGQVFTLEQWDTKPLAVGSRRPAKHGYVEVKTHRGTSGNTSGRWMLEHRFVMQQVLNRPLLPHENVHHINGDRADNRPENLELWSKSQPSGQRVADKVAWAIELLELYAPEALRDGAQLRLVG